MPAANGIWTQCHQCGKAIYRPMWRLRRTERQFCNHACFSEWKKTQTGENANSYKGTQVQVQCSQCGKQIERDPAKVRRNDHFFCGGDCWNEWRKTHMRGENNPNWTEPVKTYCATCGKPVERNPARVGTTERKVHFCCKDCKHKWLTDFMSGPTSPNWKGGVVKYYGPNWHRQKRLARKRDNNTCRVCGATQKKNGKALDVHHVTPFRSFNYVPGENDNYVQANDLGNLVCLCMKCHRKVEHGVIALQPNLL